MHLPRALHLLPLALGVSLLGGGLTGCVYEESVLIYNMSGKIVVPRAAATRVFAGENGAPDTEIVDVRNIGPVYIGLYPGVQEANVIASYPHPDIGPIYKENVQGDTYPYGGTTVGDLRFACFDNLTCRLTSGRYESYQHIVDWFNDTLEAPVVDADLQNVEDGEYFRQTCMDLMEVTSDEEVMLLPPDRNGDEKIDAKDLDFVEDADGNFVGEFKIWQQDFFSDPDDTKCTPGLDCRSFVLWAYMDAPATDGGFVTCDNSGTQGFEVEEYNHDFFGGRVFEDVLNQPDSYIGAGDWVANQYMDGNNAVDGFFEWQNVYDQPTIILGHEVTQ